MATIQNTTPTILLEKPVHEVPPRSRPNSAVIRSVINDEGLPEVVHPDQNVGQNVYYDAPIPVDSETDKRFHEAPIPIGTLDEPAPPLPARKSTPQYPYSPDSFAPQQPPHSQPLYSQPPHSPGSYAHQGPPQYHNNGGYAQRPPSYSGNQVITYVTPLHELGDHPKFVDCPFCQRRAETRVKKTSSKFTHASATALGFTTIVGAAVPYAGNWACHTTHYCTNCEHKVAMRKWGSREMKAFGTPDHMREVSRYPSASSQTMSNGSRMG